MRDVEILLQKCDVANVLLAVGVKFERRSSKRGHELYFRCFTNNHKDDPGKLRMSVAESGKYKGQYYCWACGERGNLIHLMRRLLGIGFADAVARLEGQYGSSEIHGTEGLKYALRMFKEVDTVEEIREIEMPDGFRPLLDCRGFEPEKARKWLAEERQIADYHITKYDIRWGKLDTIGGVIAIPIVFKDKLASMFFAQPFKGGAKRYPKNSPQGRILYNYDYCIRRDNYVMVESILDVIKIDALCEVPAMACFTNMISKQQLSLLTGFHTHAVMPDLDGERGWDLVNRMVTVTGKNLMLYFCPIGKDPGDCTHSELENAFCNGIAYHQYETEQLLIKKDEHAKINRIRKK